MTMKTQKLLIVLSVVMSTACAKQGLGDAVTVTSCDNTFVVADQGWIKLFEHELGGTHAKLVRDINVPEGGVLSANYLCGRNEIVNDYAFRGRGGVVDHQDEGIEIRPLNGRMERYPFNKDGASNLIPYRNGVLFDTTLLQKEPIDPNLGFLSKREQASGVPLTVGSYISDRKRDVKATHHVFTWLRFFDLDQRKVTRSYRHDSASVNWLEGDALITKGVALSSLDLITDFRVGIYEFPEDALKSAKGRLDFRGGVILRAMGNFYAVASERAPKSGVGPFGRPYMRQLLPTGMAPSKPSQCKCMAIYKLDFEHGEWRERLRIPYDDITYAIDRGEFIYLFTRASGKVLRYDTQANTFEEIPFDTGGRSVIAASYTGDNFVLIFGVTTSIKPPPDRNGPYRTTASMMVVSQDFQQHSQPVDFGYVGYLGITTQQRQKLEGESIALNEFEDE